METASNSILCLTGRGKVSAGCVTRIGLPCIIRLTNERKEAMPPTARLLLEFQDWAINFKERRA